MPQIPEEAFRRTDETPDEEFYLTPRNVTHIDGGAGRVPGGPSNLS